MSKIGSFARSRLLRSSAIVPVAALLGTTSVWAQAVNLGRMGGNAIVPDGRTATTLSVHGRVTDVRTSTFSGGNAYNSFSTFREAAGNTVNLRVPHRAKNLVNIVRDGPVDIQGTLNAYKNGKIGGNVVFADPYGFVVGKGGSVNVGTLAVVTPSGATLDQIIDAKGNVNRELAARAIRGDVPLSSDGSVVIDGRINARHFVRVTAHDVQVAGSMSEAKKAATHRAQFESTVNAGGMIEGGAIIVRHGTISITAAGNASIAGRLVAGGTSHQAGAVPVKTGRALDAAATAGLSAAATRQPKKAAKTTTHVDDSASISISAGETAEIGGQIAVRAGKQPGQIDVTASDIGITSTAAFLAKGSGTADGGHVSIKAVQDTSVAAGARFIADARGTGNGGFVEISATDKDVVDPNIVLNLGAAHGKAGTLLFDPNQLIIAGQTTDASTGGSPVVGGGSVSTHASLFTNGANVELDAISSIEIAGVIDTRATGRAQRRSRVFWLPTARLPPARPARSR